MKRRLAVLVLAFTMVLTMGASVFAANGDNAPNPNTVHDTAAADALLVKYVQIPEGVDLTKEAMANKTFVFHFEPAAPDDTDYGVPAAKFSGFDVTSAKISEMGAATQTGEGQADEDTQNKVWSESIADIFATAGPNGAAYSFPQAGEYKFTVSETSTAATGWVFASDTYTLRVVVGNTKGITDVTVQNSDGEKVDPTDPTPGDNPGGATPSDSNGGFTFTNQYKPTVTNHDEPGNDPDNPNPPDDPKNPDPIPDDPDHPGVIDEDHPTVKPGAFVLDKYVLGEYGDQTKEFNFKVTVKLPKGYTDFELPEGWTAGTAKDVNLAHGAEFKFDELPVGAKITVAETPVDGYTPFWTTSQSDDGLVVTITEKGGYAICRNGFDDESITPTGIIINNLPYVLLIGIALGGIVLFSRKRRYE